MTTHPAVRRAMYAFIGLSVLSAMTAVPAAAQDDDAPFVVERCDDRSDCESDQLRPAPDGVDAELFHALVDIEFIDTWYSITSIDPRLSLAAVHSERADASRQVVLDHIDDLGETAERTDNLRSATRDTLAQRRNVDGNIGSVDQHILQLGLTADDVERKISALRADLAVIVKALQDAAVGLYVSETQTAIPGPDDVDTFNARQALGVQINSTIEELFSWRNDLDDQIADQVSRLVTIGRRVEEEQGDRADLVDRRHTLSATLDSLAQSIATQITHRIEVEKILPDAMSDAQGDRLTALLPKLGISLVTLDAYVRAEKQVTNYYPNCSITWELLAGIATVESGHATFGGGYVQRDGQISRKILGPVLDGTLEDTQIVTDTDNGSMDRNTEFDRAVGPFQFLPQTWRSFKLDATDDNWADPHNLYDAALTAAGYLCASGNLADERGLRQSVLTYNHSEEYLEDVTDFTRDYRLTFELPEAGYDPETLIADGSWRVRLNESPAPDALANTGF